MKLYIFEHCPYCIKALMVANSLNIPLDVHYLQNDDEQTPIALVGKKVVPILVKENNQAMAESLDIAEYFCQLANTSLAQGSHFSQAQQWVEKHIETFLRLTFVRWPQLALPEYGSQSAIDYFTHKKEARLGASFPDVLAQSAQDISAMESALNELTWLQGAENITWADVAIYPFLRNLTVVKNLRVPAHVQQYVAQLSKQCSITTFEDMAV